MRFSNVLVVSALLAIGCDRTPTTSADAGATSPSVSAASSSSAPVPTTAAPARLDADAIGEAAGTKASTEKDGVVRIGWSRTDVKVRVDGAALDPAAGLGSWAAFEASPHGAMVMGDTVVFQDEVDAAMDAAFAHGLDVTALHNHFFYDEPKVYFMHVGGHGAPAELARSVKAVWDAIKKVRADHAEPASSFGGAGPVDGALDAKAIETAVGHPAAVNGKVVKVTVARQGKMGEAPIGGSMGLSTWAAFSGSDAHATVDGDFIMTAAEMPSVLRALRKANLHVVALHNHMSGGEPFFFFTHYWGKGTAANLARGFRSALDAQSAVAPARP